MRLFWKPPLCIILYFLQIFFIILLLRSQLSQINFHCFILPEKHFLDYTGRNEYKKSDFLWELSTTANNCQQFMNRVIWSSFFVIFNFSFVSHIVANDKMSVFYHHKNFVENFFTFLIVVEAIFRQMIVSVEQGATSVVRMNGFYSSTRRVNASKCFLTMFLCQIFCSFRW